MAEPLVKQYGPAIPREIASRIRSVYPQFQEKEFLRFVLKGYERCALKERAIRICEGMRKFLPPSFPVAMTILLRSLGPKHDSTEYFGMAPFLYLPHTLFVATYGTKHFALAMKAQYELTQRFTAEYSIRTFLELEQDRTLKTLRSWIRDPSPHVRRLISEGTRPRLPWAQRLPQFQHDPKPVLSLLEMLKDDPSLYVRRSVANNLNDIGKDNPKLLIETARRWMASPTPERAWVVSHGLRSLVKKGDREALGILGYGQRAHMKIQRATITPKSVRRGTSIEIRCVIKSTVKVPQQVLVDLKIHYVKASGGASPKVFKVRSFMLSGGMHEEIIKKISLKEMTTRKHYPGLHTVELLINGSVHPIGVFRLL